HDTELVIAGSTPRLTARITAGSIVVAKSSLGGPRSRGAIFPLRVWAALTPLAVAEARRLVRISNCGWVWIRGQLRRSRGAGNVPRGCRSTLDPTGLSTGAIPLASWNGSAVQSPSTVPAALFSSRPRRGAVHSPAQKTCPDPPR